MSQSLWYVYKEFFGKMDERIPVTKGKELDITIIVESNHDHDNKSWRSITCLIVLIISVLGFQATKSSTQTSTFGAKFDALKKSVLEVVTTRYGYEQ